MPTGPSCLPRNEGAHSVNAERFPYSTGPVETGPQCTGHWPGFCPHQIHHSSEPLCSRQPPPTKRRGVSAALNQAPMSGPSLHQPMESLLINPSMIFLIPLTALLPHHLHAFLGCLGPCVHRLELPWAQPHLGKAQPSGLRAEAQEFPQVPWKLHQWEEYFNPTALSCSELWLVRVRVCARITL